METAGTTHPGLKRKNNQDALAIRPDLGLAIVADGVGGAPCGDIASARTVESIAASMRGVARGREEEAIRRAIADASAHVRESGAARPGCRGLRSTVVFAYWNGPRFWIANVGDSRAYRLRDSILTQLSYDQNITTQLRDGLGLPEEQVRQYAAHNALTMSIGDGAEPVVRIHGEVFEDGDLLLLCTDGLSAAAGDAAIHAIMASGDDLKEMVDHLVNRALLAGGPDNITAVLLRYRA